MTLQVWRDWEGSLAELALVRLLARVGPQVSCQVGRSGKCFATIFAAVSFFIGLAHPSCTGAPQHGFQCFLYWHLTTRDWTHAELRGHRAWEGGLAVVQRRRARGPRHREAAGDRRQPQALLETFIYGTMVISGRQAGGGRVLVWQEVETITDQGIIQGEEASWPRPCEAGNGGLGAGDLCGLGRGRGRPRVRTRGSYLDQVAVFILDCRGLGLVFTWFLLDTEV